MSTKKKLQVFISSTYQDLKPERQAAVEAILKSGHIPAGMELFSAGSESQLETIRRWIDESDVYMLILGGRYGSVDPKTSLSYTELEYDYAVAQGKPLFAVVITESALDKKIKDEGRDAMETENPKELKLFKEKVLTRISTFFSDSKDIKLAVHETIADLQNRNHFTGWVSGKEVPDVTSLIDEIARLRGERDEALKQASEAKIIQERTSSKSPSSAQNEEFRELITALKNLEISTKVFNQAEDEPAIDIPVIRIFDAMRDTLITGVTNRSGISDIHKLLYYNICPKLEMHGLAAIEKVPGVAWQRYRLTTKGKGLLVFLDKNKPKSKETAIQSPEKAETQTEATNPPAAKKTTRRTLKSRD